MILKHISSDMFLFLPNATPSKSKDHKGWCESSTTKMKPIDNGHEPHYQPPRKWKQQSNSDVSEAPHPSCPTNCRKVK
jgi:hypothetical protein